MGAAVEKVPHVRPVAQQEPSRRETQCPALLGGQGGDGHGQRVRVGKRPAACPGYRSYRFCRGLRPPGTMTGRDCLFWRSVPSARRRLRPVCLVWRRPAFVAPARADSPDPTSPNPRRRRLVPPWGADQASRPRAADLGLLLWRWAPRRVTRRVAGASAPGDVPHGVAAGHSLRRRAGGQQGQQRHACQCQDWDSRTGGNTRSITSVLASMARSFLLAGHCFPAGSGSTA